MRIFLLESGIIMDKGLTRYPMRLDSEWYTL
jgi:hypothetical protein